MVELAEISPDPSYWLLWTNVAYSNVLSMPTRCMCGIGWLEESRGISSEATGRTDLTFDPNTSLFLPTPRDFVR